MARGLVLTAVSPLHVAAYIRTHPGSAPTVKQHLAAIRMLGDWLVVSQVLPVNPAAAVRGPGPRLGPPSSPSAPNATRASPRGAPLVVVKVEIYLSTQSRGVIVHGSLKYRPPTESSDIAVSITGSGKYSRSNVRPIPSHNM